MPQHTYLPEQFLHRNFHRATPTIPLHPECPTYIVPRLEAVSILVPAWFETQHTPDGAEDKYVMLIYSDGLLEVIQYRSEAEVREHCRRHHIPADHLLECLLRGILYVQCGFPEENNGQAFLFMEAKNYTKVSYIYHDLW